MQVPEAAEREPEANRKQPEANRERLETTGNGPRVREANAPGSAPCREARTGKQATDNRQLETGDRIPPGRPSSLSDTNESPNGVYGFTRSIHPVVIISLSGKLFIRPFLIALSLEHFVGTLHWSFSFEHFVGAHSACRNATSPMEFFQPFKPRILNSSLPIAYSPNRTPNIRSIPSPSSTKTDYTFY